MGTFIAVPYVSLVDVCTMRRTSARQHGSTTFWVLDGICLH